MSDNQTPTPEETPESETVSKEQYDQLVDKYATMTQDKANLVDEIKNVRKQKTDAEEALAASVETPPAIPASEDGTEAETIAQVAGETVKRILDERAETDAKVSKEASLSAFKTTHKEFQSDNDPAGIKFAALEAKLKMFNLDQAKTTSEFDAILSSAYALLDRDAPVEPDAVVTPQPNDSSSGGGQPEEANATDDISEKEMRIVRTTYDGNKEAYLKARAKRPDYVARLVELSTI